MSKTIEGIYRDGKIELSETPYGVCEGTRAVVIFLPPGAIDIKNEKNTEVGYSEFWVPIRNGEFGELFTGKPVRLAEDRIVKVIPDTGVKVELNITNQRCYIRLYFKDADHREEIMALFPKPDYNYEYDDSPKETKVIFPVLDKGKKDLEHYPEIREKLVAMGTDIYNKINESDL